ncbi:Uncharacterised protein [Mycobacteroides abscessus subsp. massiliense]|uniref:hypothetical protein n=1 Tax=Mycobacteroides abscessus TaxID=36809 RepID=UPI0009A6B68E|nr:hypothetical protein [Mycobacteroides abscessus]SKK91173.1 Uncharacterised protein [Mycobacteroides abscessus subsp. massiliense]
MVHHDKSVIAVRSIAAPDDLTIKAGTAGHVVESSMLGTPKRVRFTLHSDAGNQDVIVEVNRGDVA